MKDDKVYCPWCRREMELEHYGIDEDEYFVYVCPDCAAQSPISYSAESALATAIARPTQKPLTLKEFCERLCSPVWFESHGTYRGKKGFWIIPQRFLHYPKCETVCYASENSSANSELSLNAYGEVWRAWATKPTEEEREAAKWDE